MILPLLLLLAAEDLTSWNRSVAILTAVQVADVASSWRKLEANILLTSRDGSFGYRGLAVKSSIVGGSVALQWRLARKRPKLARTLAAVNLAYAGAGGVIVGVNLRRR